MKTDRFSAIPNEWVGISKLFVALGDEQRQRILLAFEPGERLNVSQIVSTSALSRPAVSHHLKILREAGVLSCEKTGKEIYFWINRSAIMQALQGVHDYVKNQT